jgi:hypothetical protein
VYAGKRSPRASVRTVGRSTTRIACTDERTPSDSTTYCAAESRSNRRAANVPSRSPGVIGTRSHSVDAPRRTSSSAPSAAKPRSVAETARSAPRATVTSPGFTATASTGAASAAAPPHGQNTSRAPERTNAGPRTISAAAAASAPTALIAPRRRRERSTRAPYSTARTRVAACADSARASVVEPPSAVALRASTALSSAASSDGSCSST